ncbi:hypothetical protein ACVWXO_005980 [Bradyrhizobium sp. LM2.7]
MIGVREYQEQLLATYRDRLARIERGEVPYSAKEQAVEIQRLQAAIKFIKQDLEGRH